MSDESNTLKAQTEAKVAAGRKGNPDFMKGVDETIAQAKAFQEGADALNLDQNAPRFELPNQHAEQVLLDELLAKGPVVITFYRGSWCPYCNLELKALNDFLPQFKTKSAQLVAISPQLPDQTLTTAQKNELEFDVLSDIGNKVAQQFGLLFTLDKRIQELYTGFGIDFEHTYGDKTYQLPLPATYVINQEGVITYAFLNEDYTLRAEPSDVMTALDGENK